MPEQLWAPWRLRYIENADKKPGRLFVDLPAEGEAQDATNLIVHRGSHAYILMNAFPYANGHLMVIPYRYTADLEDYDDDELLAIMRLTRLAVRLLKIAFRPEAFNIGINLGRSAGAGIADHLHWHIVPRWNGDTNFMTVLADVRVVPESLPAVYERLRAALPDALAREAQAGQADPAV